MAVQNLAVKLCGILQSQTNEEVSALEWRLLGQEQDGSQLLSWVSIDKDDKEVLHVGIYTNKSKTLKILYTFTQKLNIIQASVNPTHSLLVYVVKILPSADNELAEALYCPYLVCLLPDDKEGCVEVEDKSNKQIMLQFVYGKSNKYSPGIRNDRFLLIKHLEYIKIYRSPSFLNELDDGTEKWGFDGIYPEPETIVKEFTWAQWDCAIQALYYIHYRAAPAQSLGEGEDSRAPDATPALSALQFHADLPHETVLNIPLSLPQVSGATEGAACGGYSDDPVPLRVHDCSIDLQLVCDPRGLVCICHHYLYKALDDSTNSLVLEDSTELRESGVNFAYSITVLHHGCVVHSAVPDLPWMLAKSLRPSYTLYSDHTLLVHIPNLYTHLIDISPQHEPCSHIVIPTNETNEVVPSLAPLLGWGPNTMVDLNTLDIVTMIVTDKDIIATYKSDTSFENQLSILHYLLLHEGNVELAEDLIAWQSVSGGGGAGRACRAMQQFMVGLAHAAARRALPAAAAPLLQALPHSLQTKPHDVQTRGMCVCVCVAGVWRAGAGGAGVLAPRQRVAQFSEDAWTRVWVALSRPRRARLAPARARQRRNYAVDAYRPEALSGCSTPLSPAGGPPSARRSSLCGTHDSLPFVELDHCTASTQEHVIAANQREVSVHLMSELGEQAGEGGAGGIHAVATRWAAAQLDASRTLCRAVCKAAGLIPASNQQKGFSLVDEMEPNHQLIAFKMLEQYYMACEPLAFPVPQGFSSFFTYLGYKALPFSQFMQYVHRNVLELQIDVLKAIIATKDDRPNSAANKLRLIQVSGEGRGRRALAAWRHRAALQLRARDHAHTLLSGGGARRHDPPPARRAAAPPGIAALPAGSRLSPLDTFLDLLTAKASLNELHFNLIIEATLASVQRDCDN